MRSKLVQLTLVSALSWGPTICFAQKQQPDPIPLPDGVRRLVEDTKKRVDDSLAPVDPPTTPRRRMPLEEAVATIQFASGRRLTSRSRKNIFETVGVLPAQAVTVYIHYPLAMAGRVVRLQVLDGGALSPTLDAKSIPGGEMINGDVVSFKDLLVDEQGTLRFEFQAGLRPGRYQVRLSPKLGSALGAGGPREWGLPFYVLDQLYPRNNPPALTEPNLPLEPVAIPTPGPSPLPPILPPLPPIQAGVTPSPTLPPTIGGDE